jgi:ornithine cyclodeaminase/alanine dehydrogenase-like protein (mu-crystallin family)
MVAYHPTNPRLRGLPTILSSVYVFNTDSGHLEGLVDATFTTALRTGAVSALASRVLASPASRTLGIIGCGTQAVTQAHALSRIFPIEQIIGFDVDPAASASFPTRIGFLNAEVEMVRGDALETLARRADILCTCTSAEPGHGPVFRPCDVADHLHINAVGSDFPGKFEVPFELLRHATVCPDFREQALREGECQQLAADAVGPDLAELLRSPERFLALRGQLTVFDSTGWALVDHLVALEILRLARQHGLGTRV